ncbi:zinc finger MYM-type protein 1-like [Planococcus citri]|uniref:zinc finger MYM-type protein 1-like n=1 Tax=Planococcus citri TaxID=170843 RepID=UPI0031FA48EB
MCKGAGQQPSSDVPSSSPSSTSAVPENIDAEENIPHGADSDLTSSRDENTEANEIEKNVFVFNSDPATWIANEFYREYVALNGYNQNKNSDFKESKRVYSEGNRYLNHSAFKKKLLNGEIGDRTWLVYSKSTGSVICAPCFLFGDTTDEFAFKQGFNDWKNIHHLAPAHENSDHHKQSFLKLFERAQISGRVDQGLAEQLQEEISYWKEVLKRIVATVKTLASRGLSFRGTNEHFGVPNNGNFLMLLEYLRQFDPFIDEHIRNYGDKGSGSTSYLSKTIYEEVIEIMAGKVTSKIVEEIKIAKYYSIIVDSTPDISNIDQLSFILRYVKPDGTVAERFLTLLENPGHKGKDLYDAVTSTLKSHGIDILDMRGQSYDNAANMKGIYSGLQARIKKDNPLAEYTPCSAHSLNLVGTHAAESCSEASRFFELVQEVYNFFSDSTERWFVMQHFADSKFAKLKSLSTTRWSARADAVSVMNEFWSEIINALSAYEENSNEKAIVRSKAKGLRKKMQRLESALMLSIWSVLLERFDATSQKLQAVDTSISDTLDLYKSLVGFIEDARENFHLYEETAQKISTKQEFEKDVRRTKKRKLMSDELPKTRKDEVELSGRDDFRVNTFNVILDRILQDLNDKCRDYERIFQKFIALVEFGTLDQSDLRKHAASLQEHFPNDLELVFVNELCHFQKYCKVKKIETKPPLDILKFIRQNDLQGVFPNVDIAYRLLNCTAVTNCSAERSFSCLKRIKDYLSSTTSQDRLVCQMILAIEAELMFNMEFDDIIKTFAEKKARRKIFDSTPRSAKS